MIIKCCGLNPTRDVQVCLDLKVDFLGFIFYEKSPRNVKISDLDILNNYNRKNALFTAVTVDADNQMIDQISSKNIQCLQLHGSETNERIEEIKNRSKLKIIKTIQVKNENDIMKYKKLFKKNYIYINPSFTSQIVGMTTTDSNNLLSYLFNFMCKPEFQIRFKWTPNTLVIWDNRCTMHYAIGDYMPNKRVMHRVTVLNDRRD